MIILILILLGIEILLIAQPISGNTNRLLKHFILFSNLGLILGLILLLLEIDVKVIHKIVSVFFIIVSSFLLSMFSRTINR